MATAFAHLSGWKLLESHILHSTADIQLVAGLHFCQTEPEVLRKWLLLARQNDQVQAFLAVPTKPMFHPKVLIVNGSREGFPIIGSGNLSAGGLRDITNNATNSVDVVVLLKPAAPVTKTVGLTLQGGTAPEAMATIARDLDSKVLGLDIKPGKNITDWQLLKALQDILEKSEPPPKTTTIVH